jgi:serine/threonine protein kinase
MIIKDISSCNAFLNKLGKVINSGGNGIIYEMKNNPNIVAKTSKIIPNTEDESDCINGNGCLNDIIMEALILYNLSTLNCEHFVKLEDIYLCDDKYYILMEKINGADFTTFKKYNFIDNEMMLSILFQITYALYIANSKLNFVHGDLIGKNIIISNVDRQVKTYIVEGKKIKIDNFGIRVILIDFGFSRLKHDKWKLFYPKSDFFKTDEDLFNGTADICKLYRNPNFKLKTFDSTMINGYSLTSILNNCKSHGWSYVAIPPFPLIKAEDILLSSLFNDIITKSPKKRSPKKPSPKKPSPKKKRCPNGTRRDKKTGECVKK